MVLKQIGIQLLDDAFSLIENCQTMRLDRNGLCDLSYVKVADIDLDQGKLFKKIDFSATFVFIICFFDNITNFYRRSFWYCRPNYTNQSSWKRPAILKSSFHDL